MAREQIVRRDISFCFAHRLPDDPGACQNLHGHNVTVTVEALGPTDANGMVMSFADLKTIMVAQTEALFDHMLVLRFDDPLVETLVNKALVNNAGFEELVASMKESINATGYFDSRAQVYTAFLDNLKLITIAQNPTSENLSFLIHRLLGPALAARGITFHRVIFQETEKCSAICGGDTRPTADFPQIT